MRELAGKGWRVLGYFIWMLGVGIWLDHGPRDFGFLLMLSGASLFFLGVAQSVIGGEAFSLAPAAPPVSRGGNGAASEREAANGEGERGDSAVAVAEEVSRVDKPRAAREAGS